MAPKPHHSRYFALAMYICALIGGCLGSYHIGYKDGYIQALRTVFMGFDPTTPAKQHKD